MGSRMMLDLHLQIMSPGEWVEGWSEQAVAKVGASLLKQTMSKPFIIF